MKLFVVFSLLVLVLVGYSSGQRRDIQWGLNVKGDEFMYSTTVHMPPSPKGQKNEMRYVLPHNITCIKAIDLITDYKGGNAVLIAGGPGQKKANFRFESQPGRGYHFIMIFWGK